MATYTYTWLDVDILATFGYDVYVTVRHHEDGIVGLAGDVEETKKLWKNSSLGFRLLLGLSIFLSTSSIASLADAIFKWRGFVLDAVNFLRMFVSEPITNSLAKIGINYEALSIDYLILLLLFGSSALRLFWVNYFDKEITFLNSAFNTVLVISAVFWSFYKLAGAGVVPSQMSFLVIVGLYIGWNLVFSFTLKERVIMLAPVFIAVLIALLLGAVNSGISKPL